MLEGKTPFSLCQVSHKLPPLPILGAQVQCLPRGAGGEVGVLTAWWRACVGTSSCVAWER